MSTLRYAMNVPLALLAGAALASNPRLFPPTEDSHSTVHTKSVVEAIREQEPLDDSEGDPMGRRGPESPELRALRLAEEQFFDEMYGEDDTGALQAMGSLSDIDDSMSGDGQWDGLNRPSIPIAQHPLVRRYVDFFSSSPKGREMFEKWLKRSGRYREIIGSALRKYGLPGDLEAMVFVESGFWPTAKSSAGAVGLWQFMPATARAYGLSVSRTLDERRNPWRASDAAAAHLTDLHQRFQSWDLALAAYNYGYHNIETRLTRADARDFWDLVDHPEGLPEETRKYVPKVQAVAMLLNNLDHYGFGDTRLDEPLRAVEFEVPPGTQLDALVRAAGTSRAEFTQLNPEFLSNLVPDRGSPITIHIPRENLARARVMLPRLLGGAVREQDPMDDAHFDWGENGDRDSGQGRLMATAISKAERLVQVAELESSKDERTTDRLDSRLALGHSATERAESMSQDDGALCGVPARSEDSGLMMSKMPARTESEPARERSTAVSPASAAAMAFLSYRVSRGDSLSEIAKRFGVHERELVLDNGIKNRSLIFNGQSLRIRDAKLNPERKHIEYIVRRGDSLSKIAARLRHSEEELAKANKLTDPDLIRIGQVVLIPPT